MAALTPKAEIEGEMGEPQMGLQARLMSQALRKLTANIKRTNTLVIFINQIRMKIGVMFGNPETTTGGNALKFYASVRMDIRRIGSIKKGDEVIGSETRVKVVKNKVAPPFKQAEFDIMYGDGISREGEVLEIGVNLGVLEKSGAWYVYNGDRLGQGKDNARDFLKENPRSRARSSRRSARRRACAAPKPAAVAEAEPSENKKVEQLPPESAAELKTRALRLLARRGTIARRARAQALALRRVPEIPLRGLDFSFRSSSPTSALPKCERTGLPASTVPPRYGKTLMSKGVPVELADRATFPTCRRWTARAILARKYQRPPRLGKSARSARASFRAAASPATSSAAGAARRRGLEAHREPDPPSPIAHPSTLLPTL